MTPRSTGFSLIEILIALLVLSIGLTGLAALQLTALKRAQSSYHLSLATAAALDFEERAWLRLAERPSPLCLDAAEVATIRADVESLWRVDGPSTRAGIPSLSITAGRGTATSEYVPISLTLVWGQAGSRIDPESFDFTFNALCRPQPAANGAD